MTDIVISPKSELESWESEGGVKARGSKSRSVDPPMLRRTAPPAFILPKLPYAENALEPVISARTMSFHYRKHHAGYIDTLNRLVEGTAFSGLQLADVMVRAAADPKAVAIFHNAAQAWNHAFYWTSMRQGGGGAPDGQLKGAVERDFGGFKELRAAFIKAATAEFGSGWIWLIVGNSGTLEVTATANADTPLAHAQKPLIVLDLWEHAYYLDYQNRRADYVAAWLDNLVDWRFAEQNFA